MRLTCILKNRKGRAEKVRWVVKLRRSKVNCCFEAPERLFLQRVEDALGDAVHLMHRARAGARADALVAGSCDAFHMLPAHGWQDKQGARGQRRATSSA